MSDLKRITTLAEQLAEATANAKRLDEELKAAKKLQRQIEEEDLPTLMDELGLTEIRLKSGELVKIQRDCQTSITEATHDKAMEWLVENGFGGIIKTGVVVEFGRGEIKEADKAAKALAKKYPQTVSNESVHHSTLKAFVMEQLREGKPLPTDLFNLREFNKAVIRKK